MSPENEQAIIILIGPQKMLRRHIQVDQVLCPIIILIGPDCVTRVACKYYDCPISIMMAPYVL